MKDAMEKQRADLKKLLGELQTIQTRMANGEKLPAEEGEAADAKAMEAETLQREIKQYDDRTRRFSGIQEEASKLADPAILPPDNQPESDRKTERKTLQDLLQKKAADQNPVVGFMRLGDYIVAQKALHDHVARNLPKAQVMLGEVGSLISRKGHGEPLVPVSLEMVKAAMESKAVPTIGDGVIEPTRVPDLVRVTEHDRLQLRDILDIQQTNSDAVKYTRVTSYTRAAATVANSASKPQSGGLVMDSVTEPVKTVAVWIPVEEQQLSDYPALSGLINGELLYDVDKHLEELVMYGDGTGEDFTGILMDSAVGDCRTQAGDTLIDISRRGITDVRKAGYEPNGIMVDPLDWEDIVLEKGTDNRYVWVVVTDGATQRLWAVPVIETVAMEDYAGVTTEARNLLIGDFARGATLWDRMRSQISVGWINDQFIKNQRTILAEMRAAFGVKRPGAFRKYETQAASSS